MSENEDIAVCPYCGQTNRSWHEEGQAKFDHCPHHLAQYLNNRWAFGTMVKGERRPRHAGDLPVIEKGALSG